MANAMTGQTFIRPGIIKVPWHLAVVVICISIVLEWYQTPVFLGVNKLRYRNSKKTLLNFVFIVYITIATFFFKLTVHFQNWSLQLLLAKIKVEIVK